ncbi:MAG: hypothetical protein ABSC56_00910 [Solirubrobacteraceae bacterium]
MVQTLELAPSRYGIDSRFAALRELIAGGDTAVLSVDCFDTILWRRVAKPSDLFVVLGEELRSEGHLDASIDPLGFGRMRVAAESLARLRKQARAGTPEVKLDEIYAELPSHISDLDAADMQDREVDLERRLTVADPALCDELCRLAGDGIELILVSDTYLSADQLSTLLDKPECGELRHARVFTSCDMGMSKEGGLWHRMPATLAVRPGQIVHVGNNRRADFVEPQAAGVRAMHWAERSESLSLFLEKEIAFRVDGARDASEDNGVTALRGRARFLHHEQPDQEESWQLGVEVLGPVFVGYADWVCERTAALGITRALCTMREGRFFKELLDAGVPGSVNPDLRSRLLWASRTALTRVLLADADRGEIERALTVPRPASIRGAANLLGLDLARFPTFARIAEQAPHLSEDPAALQMFMNAVWEAPGILEEIQATARRRRENFIRHLREAIGDGTGDVAVLDVGWIGSNQERLQTVLDRAGFGVRLHGLYLSADMTPPDRLLRGHVIEGFIPGRDPGPGGFEPAFSRNRLVLEPLLLSGDGTTLEIGDDGVPICDVNRPSTAQAQQTRAIQEGVLAYQQHVAGYRSVGESSQIGRIGGRDARTIVERFVTAPTREEAQLLGSIVHDDSHSNMHTLTLVPSPDDLWARRLTTRQLASERWERVWWAAGASAMRDSPASPLAPLELSSAGVLRVQIARRNKPQTDSVQVPMKLGMEGTSIAKLRAPGNDLDGVVVFPTITPGLMRLDCLRLLIAAPTNGWRKAVWTWTAGDDPERILGSECERITPNILKVGPGSSLTVRLTDPLPTPSWFELEFRGAFMPLVDGAPQVTRTETALHVTFEPAPR